MGFQIDDLGHFFMPPKPRRRITAEESSAIVQAFDECKGDMNNTFKHNLVKELKLTERQIENHVKYLRTKKNKKINEATGPSGMLQTLRSLVTNLHLL